MFYSGGSQLRGIGIYPGNYLVLTRSFCLTHAPIVQERSQNDEIFMHIKCRLLHVLKREVIFISCILIKPGISL